MVAKDDYVIVLDFLPHGRSGDRKAEPLAQAIGEKFFNLLEIIIKDGVAIKPKDKLYIGGDKREEVKYIRSRIDYSQLTNFSKAELESTIKDLINSDEKKFVDFFNRAGPLTTRLHSLELLPGIGKRHMWEIINERKKKPFENFTDLKQRVSMLPDPNKMIIKRILDELQSKDRHRLFVASARL
jgi:putative nucleotide binding protein